MSPMRVPQNPQTQESTENAGFVGKPVPGKPCSDPPTGVGPAHDKDMVGSPGGVLKGVPPFAPPPD